MRATIQHKDREFTLDLAQPIDLSIPLRAGLENVIAWYLDPVRIEPVRSGDFVGDVNQGSPVNFRNIWFNPHGHGTHTECVGHISGEPYSINQTVKRHFFLAQVVTVSPEERAGDLVITQAQLASQITSPFPEALIIRTLPNDATKLTRHYSHTNPPYLAADAAAWLADQGLEHLLIDLPSVDREEDEGALAAHKAFWRYPEQVRTHCTITELIFVPDSAEDGSYLLDLAFASFENDAAPARPVIYRIEA